MRGELAKLYTHVPVYLGLILRSIPVLEVDVRCLFPYGRLSSGPYVLGDLWNGRGHGYQHVGMDKGNGISPNVR